jgi:quercetin dioxygenase-like cupin family protein
VHSTKQQRWTGRAALTGAMLLTTVALGPAAVAANSSSTNTGITRTALGQAAPDNAPGQELYLQRVRIEPGAKLAEHFHQGTQVAHIIAGVLTYDIASGTAAVTRRGGKTGSYTGPTTIRLRTGDSLVETQGLVHHGENSGKVPVVIELASLLQAGAPLSTPVGTSAPGTPLLVNATLDSQARTLNTVGADGALVYGWNQLAGTDSANGVGVAMLASVDYTKGSGPFFGFVTFTFADGSTLGVQMQGTAVGATDGSGTKFASTLGVIGGTGRYVAATGTGTFTGSRTAALGTAVSATFDLTLTGAN